MEHKNVETARQGLGALKKDIIGVFKTKGANGSNDYEMVVAEHDNGTIDTIHITPFGVINESFFMPKYFGEYHRFPEDKNMEEILTDPFEWAKFIKNFN